MSARWRGSRPGERLVEDEHLRVVDERLGDLDALAHPLRVRRAACACRPGRDRRARARPSAAPRRVGKTLETCAEIATNSRAVSGSKTLSCCGTSPTRRVTPVSVRGIPAEHAHGALGGAGEPAEHAEHRRLPGAVRAEQRGHARRRSSKLTSETATSAPNHFETFSATTRGSVGSCQRNRLDAPVAEPADERSRRGSAAATPPATSRRGERLDRLALRRSLAEDAVGEARRRRTARLSSVERVRRPGALDRGARRRSRGTNEQEDRRHRRGRAPRREARDGHRRATA